MTKKNYDNTSISALKGADRVRKRPSVIFGSDGIEGAEHAFFEILSNSIDEAREGYGKVIRVTRHRDLSISVEDEGRGIPLGYNVKEEKYNWELIYCELYAGGKYQNNAEGGNYEFSLGLNGLGACATQYASEWFNVEVKRDGKVQYLNFEKGENIGGLRESAAPDTTTGTKQHWKLDLEVFTDINIGIEHFKDVLKKQAVVNSGISFILYDEEKDEEFTYLYNDGIRDYVKEIAGSTSISDIMYYKDQGLGRDREDKPEYKVKAEFAFCFNNEVNLLEYYHNSSFLEYGGAPDKALKTAFVSELDSFIKELGKYQKDEKRISFQDIEDSLIVVINSFSTMTSYENQTKKAITNRYIQSFLTDFIRRNLEIYFIENRMEAEKVVEQILINKRSREKAEKTRLAMKQTLSQKIDITNRIKKFVDCRSKVIEEREIYIVEGDSALGSCKLARNAEFQAIIPIRGKILNCLKADEAKILENEIISDLIAVLGCGIELKKGKHKEKNPFDINKLRWGKVIICTDADYDGFQIRCLVLTMIYRLMPTLIDKGKVFIAETPLYEIKLKDKSLFAYDEKEKLEILSTLKNVAHKVDRSKGLGENEPEMMWNTTMNPEKRRLVAVKKADEEETAKMFDILLGDDLDGRKKYIEENGKKYLAEVDVI